MTVVSSRVVLYIVNEKTFIALVSRLYLKKLLTFFRSWLEKITFVFLSVISFFRSLVSKFLAGIRNFDIHFVN